MKLEEEIEEILDEFFERTCINDFLLKKGTPTEILQIKKKTPVGTWMIESAELGYFINVEDRVVIGILTEKKDDIHQVVSEILEKRAKKVI